MTTIEKIKAKKMSRIFTVIGYALLSIFLLSFICAIICAIISVKSYYIVIPIISMFISFIGGFVCAIISENYMNKLRQYKRSINLYREHNTFQHALKYIANNKKEKAFNLALSNIHISKNLKFYILGLCNNADLTNKFAEKYKPMIIN